MSDDFIPGPDDEFNTYLKAFAAELADTGTSFGFTAPEVTAFQTDADGFDAALTDAAVKTADAQAAVATKNTNRTAREATLRAYAKRIKDSTAYNEAAGRDYAIIRPASSFDPATYKTTLKARIAAGKPEIKWTKKGVQSVRFYGRLRGQLAWTYIDRDDKSPFIDQRPLAVPGVAEHREYMGRGVINDVEIGLDSDVVSVVFSG